MNKIKKAIDLLNETDIFTIMNAYNMASDEYLDGEQIYINDFDGFMELIEDFELAPNEILSFMLNNKEYKITDKFIYFDGNKLESDNNTDYCIITLKKKINNEIADLIIDADRSD